MELSTDFLVIGGGISGLLTARELRLAGHQVIIVDQSALGQESSWAGGGILLPIYPWRQSNAIAELVRASLKQYPSLCQELHNLTGVDPEWSQCGLLSTQNPDFATAVSWCEQFDVNCSPADPAVLDQLNTTPEHPLWLPEIAQVRNPRLLKALKTYLKQIGVLVIEYANVKHIEVEQQKIQFVNISNQKLKAEKVLVCAGAWSRQFLDRWLPNNQHHIQVQPVRGQMLLFDAHPDTLAHMVLDGDHYLIPRRDGKILAGSTVEQADFEKVTTEQARETLHQFATELFPALKAFDICEHWAGLRPGSPEGIPYIGLHPEIDNLGINAGHFRNGLVMGPASARLFADLILQRPTAVDPSPYALTRPN